RERRGTPGGHDAIMCLCVDADSEDIMVLPYHRAITSPRTASAPLSQDIAGQFGGRELPGEADPAEALERSRAEHPFVFVLPEGNFLVEISESKTATLLASRAPALRDLHVVVLHEALIPALWAAGAPELRFLRDATEVTQLVKKGRAHAGVLVKALEPAQIVDAAITRERMPQKASYFWPKALTGLVFRSLEQSPLKHSSAA
nr:DUF1015 family protein [Actinomycetota bacterium]